MSVTFVSGNVLASRCQVVTNTVNCVGVMGKGLAAQFKAWMPVAYFTAYQNDCWSHTLRVGHPTLWRGVITPQWILNFPTKLHWRDPSRLEWIVEGLKWFVANYELLRITSIAFPRLGCGNGGLDWPTVRSLMLHYLDPLPITVEIYE